MEETEMYYGFYNDADTINGLYSLKEAYFFVIICIYFLTILFISITMARLFSKNFIQEDK